MKYTHIIISCIASAIVLSSLVAAPPSPQKPQPASPREEFLRYFEARNAAASRIIRPDLSHLENINLTLPVEMTRLRCPGCNGKGEVVLHAPDHGQWAGRLDKGRDIHKTCPLCKGRRSWKAYPTPKQIEETAALARHDFMTLHQARGEVAVGSAFIPREIYDTTDRKQHKMVEEAYGKPCKKCNWTGLEECKRCKGSGVIDCTNKECKKGWIVTKRVVSVENDMLPEIASYSPVQDIPQSISSYHSTNYRNSSHHNHNNGYKRREEIKVDECAVCGGLGILICPECSGTRASSCSKCHGIGYKSKGN